jgi:hypothetical protein
MKKKGYFFTMDAVIGVIILIIGLIVITGFYFYSPDKEKTQGIATDISGVLANIKVNEICSNINDCTTCSYNSVENICNNNLIPNSGMTLLELFGYLHSKNRHTTIEAIINETIINKKILPYNYDMQVVLEDPTKPADTMQLYPLVTS